MESFFILLLSLFTIIISLKLLKIINGSISLIKINIISYAYYYHIILTTFIGVLLIYFDINIGDYYVFSFLPKGNIRFYACLSIIYMMISIPMTIVVLNEIFGINCKYLWNTYINSEFNCLNSKWIFILIIYLSGLSILSSIYFYNIIGFIPALKIISSTSLEIEILRHRLTFSYSGLNAYIRTFLVLELGSLLSYITYIYFRLTKKSYWFKLFIILLILSVINNLSVKLAKGMLINYIIGFIFIELYLKKFKIDFLKVIKYLIFSITSILLAAIFIQKKTIVYLIKALLNRLFIGQVSSLYFHLQLFPKQIPFLDGMYFPRFIAYLFGNECIRSAKIVSNYIRPNSETAGFMNTIFVGEAYANFGILGIIISPLIVGFVLWILHIYILKKPKTPVLVAGYIYIMVNCLPLTGGFYDFLYNPPLYFILFIIFLFSIIETKKSKRDKKLLT